MPEIRKNRGADRKNKKTGEAPFKLDKYIILRTFRIQGEKKDAIHKEYLRGGEDERV